MIHAAGFSAPGNLNELRISEDGNTVLAGTFDPIPGVAVKPCIFDYELTCDYAELVYVWERGSGWKFLMQGTIHARSLSEDGGTVTFSYSEWPCVECPYDQYIGQLDVSTGAITKRFAEERTDSALELAGTNIIYSVNSPNHDLKKINVNTGAITVLREDCEMDAAARHVSSDKKFVLCQDKVPIGSVPQMRLVEIATGVDTPIFTAADGFGFWSPAAAATIGNRAVSQLVNRNSEPDSYTYWVWSGVPAADTTPPPNPTVGSFIDDDTSIFEADIEWLAAQGITKGCNPPVNDRFCPDAFVTRGQMAAFLHRALDSVPTPAQFVEFIDDDGNIFEADIEWLGGTGVTKGCNPPTNDRYCPAEFVSRGQMAAFLVRSLGYDDDGGGNLFIDDNGNTFENDIDKLGTAGITKGCNPPANDRYCPDQFVTRGQMAAFLHRALGS